MGNIARLFDDVYAPADAQALRIVDALLFAAREPLSEEVLERPLPQGVALRDVLHALEVGMQDRGVQLVKIAGGWVYRTAPDLAYLFTPDAPEPKRLSKVATETLAIIAYHQPVTRAEIEAIRGVATSKGTLDVLLEAGFVRLRGRRRTPGRPVTYGTTAHFLSHFGLDALDDLPGLEELKGAGLLDGRLPKNFAIPAPSDNPELREDEDPLEDGAFLDEPLEDGAEELEAHAENFALSTADAAASTS